MLKNVIEGIKSAMAMQDAGIMIHALDSRKIYPLYGVWTPTSQEYLNLFSNYVAQHKNRYTRKESCVDLGSGTGVLAITLSEQTGFEGNIYSVDNQTNALKATEINS